MQEINSLEEWDATDDRNEQELLSEEKMTGNDDMVHDDTELCKYHH